MSQKKIVSLFFLLFGFSLIFAGVQEYKILSSSYNPLFTITPDNEIRGMLIVGIATAVSGFVGLLRKKVIEL
ncbi:DUF3185 family protein [Rhodohalobacter sp. SW132]|uniref:DUF3185 family protein n=1 Tax=Rhodohalobacter sp. SW132 TaxID=2293433 RepID=UPI000E232EFC|nr:DUF3185 family protein [Rhodohalobacter sp. SW132]REL24245.1 DUF3185 family protein [Rhodohalobacter sp. SW132]